MSRMAGWYQTSKTLQFSQNLVIRHAQVLAVLGEIRGGGPVWDVESPGTVCVLVADCQRPQSRARLNPETMTVSFEEFSPTNDFFDDTRAGSRLHIHRNDSHAASSMRLHIARASR